MMWTMWLKKDRTNTNFKKTFTVPTSSNVVACQSKHLYGKVHSDKEAREYTLSMTISFSLMIWTIIINIWREILTMNILFIKVTNVYNHYDVYFVYKVYVSKNGKETLS